MGHAPCFSSELFSVPLLSCPFTAPAWAKCGHRSTPVPFFLFNFLPQPAPAPCTFLRRPGWACGLWVMDGWTSTCLLFFSHHQKQNLPTPVFFLFFLSLTTPPTTSNIST
ncbi:hypothetical protein CDEST_13696 [Colletotrichum destructivum]|uniref:Secreted protein n=1 Tax=Colletotrichum destructivum TaxID=34406 RepID=A0AAX4IZX2_9PEZI|nr:hypothetical protein CDEST_13696 [Colletotrichum destructivum]